MTTPVLLDAYANVLVSPKYLKTWGPANGFNILGMALYLWGSGNALCGLGNPPQVTPAGHQWLAEATSVGMGMFGNLEIGANDPSNLGWAGGIERATTAVECYKALGVSPGMPLCLSNDNQVTNWANCIAFFDAASGVIRDAGYSPTLYGQSVVYESLKGKIDYLWHAPDGTSGPWPNGTLIAQRPNFFVYPQGYSCDVDDVIAPNITNYLWNLNGPVKPFHQENTMILVSASGPVVGKVPANSIWLVNFDRTGTYGRHLNQAQAKAWESLLGTPQSTTTANLNEILFVAP